MSADGGEASVPSMDLRSLGQDAVRLHQSGKLAEAERLYLQILQANPANFTARHLLGLIRFQQARYGEALELLGAALRIRPDAVEALTLYALVLQTMGRGVDALAAYDRVLALKPDLAEALSNRGAILLALKRPAEALTSFDRILARLPNDVPALYNRGVALQALERFEDALASYDGALAVKPDFAEALNNRGGVLRALNRPQDALASFDRSVAAAPGLAPAWNNRGNLLRDLRQFDGALASFDGALAVTPNDAETLNNRGIVLQSLKRLSEALADYDKAVALRPDYVQAWYNRGTALRAMKQIDAALASFDKALALTPDFPEALHNRANTQWMERQAYEPAIRDLEKLLQIDPVYPYARGHLLHLRMHGADWRDFESEKARIDAGVRAGAPIVRPFEYQAISESPADLKACSVLYAADQYPAAPALWKKRHHDKIRLGYVSGEFREQATAYLMAGLYEAHDKNRFELFAFDNGGGDGSPLRGRLEAAFDKIVPIANLPDRIAAETISGQEIDILIDLNGYFGLSRMEVFAYRPAPLAVNYLGFPATLGAPYIDYILADRFVIPQNEQHFYSEQVVYLPDSYQANDAKRPIAPDAPTRQDCGLAEKAFVFCNFNQGYKLTPTMFAVWMRLLRQIPDSQLWLMQSNPFFAQNLKREAARLGVDEARLVFAPPVPAPAHLARLRLADLALDSLPYNAHTTASDALWAGLPLLTCRGKSFAGRVGASLLHAIGLPELVTESLEAYETLAVRLARDPHLLGGLRQKLADNRLTTPLFDTDRFGRHVEAAYIGMWDRFQRGEPPKGFCVQADI